jgi:hypothetical protein
VISHDFATRLSSLERLRRHAYGRGFVHGVTYAVIAIIFVVWFLTVGSAP